MIKILKYVEARSKEIFTRAGNSANVEQIVSDIIENVRTSGDAALFEYCEKFDNSKLNALEVSREEIDEAYSAVGPEFIEILKKAAANIEAFHIKQVRNSFVISETTAS